MTSIVVFVTALVLVTVLLANYAYADDSNTSNGTDTSSGSDGSTTDSSSQSSSSSTSNISESSTGTITDTGTGNTVSSNTSSSSTSSSDTTNSTDTTIIDGTNSTSSDNSTNNSTNDTSIITGPSTQTNYTNHIPHLFPTINYLAPKILHHLTLHKNVPKHDISNPKGPIQLDTLVTKANVIGEVDVQKTSNQTLLGFSGEGYVAKKIISTNNLKGFSLSTWVKPDYTKGSAQFTIVSKENAFVLGINNDIKPYKTAQFSIFNGIKWITIQSTTQIDDQKWTHLAVTFDGNTSSIYVNGKLESSVQIEGIPSYSTDGLLETIHVKVISSDSSLVVGAYQDSVRGVVLQQFSGLISDLKLYNLSLDHLFVEKISQTNVPNT